MNAYASFFIENFPTIQELLLFFPVCFAWAYGCLFFAGYCKRYQGLPTGYTRKIFHFLIFTSVAVLQISAGLRIVCVFGAAASTVIFYAILRGDGHLLYEAIAREKDAPRRTYYIIAPYLATFIGGVTSNVFFGDAALIGYLVAGFGDAIGEPVGVRFGKHAYRVPSFGGVQSIRSYEGSAAVLLASFVAILLAVQLSPSFRASESSLWLVLALISTLLEAISPHGWDNAVLQIVPSWCAAQLLPFQ